ncbi:MAG: cyclase family protein [Propionibacteriaceae bacterium]
MCAPLRLDEQTKQVIAANAAEFRKVTTSPFGPEDEIGMLNLITPESAREIGRRADFGHMLDLSVDYFVGMPSFTAAGQPDFQMWMTNTPRGTVVDDRMGVGRETNELVTYSGDAVSMYTHTGTHIDTLNHFGYHRRIWNNFEVDEHLGDRVWDVCGAEKQPPIVARGVLIDIAAMMGVDVVPQSYGVGEKDLRDALKRQGTELRPGDVVLVRTGQMTLWPDDAYMVNEAGLTREGAEFLASQGAVLIGADNLSLEQIPSTDEGNWLPVHTFLMGEAGVTIMEVVNMEGLAKEELHEFAFIGAGIKFRGATAAPLRPLAMPLLDR